MGLLDSTGNPQNSDAVLGLAQGLMGASGWSRTPVTLGQALGLGMAQMQQNKMQGLQRQLLQSQVDMAKSRAGLINGLLSGDTSGDQGTPQIAYAPFGAPPSSGPFPVSAVPPNAPMSGPTVPQSHLIPGVSNRDLGMAMVLGPEAAGFIGKNIAPPSSLSQLLKEQSQYQPGTPNWITYQHMINQATGYGLRSESPGATVIDPYLLDSSSPGYGQTSPQPSAPGNATAGAPPSGKPPGAIFSTGDTSQETIASYGRNIQKGLMTARNVPEYVRPQVSKWLDNNGGDRLPPGAVAEYTRAANIIAQNYIALPQFQLTANGLPYLQRIDAALKHPGSISDEDLLDSFVKLNTSGNAVTDAQVSLITHGKSLADSLSVWRNRLSTGGVLSNQQRQDIGQLSKAIYNNYKKGYAPLYKTITGQLRQAGIPQAYWPVPDLNNLANSAGISLQQNEAASSPSPQSVSGWSVLKVE